MDSPQIVTPEIKETLLADSILFPIYFIIYFVVTMFSQIALLLLVIFKTPPAFRDFRLFLINSSLLQILMCLIICFVQVRPVMNTNSTAYLFSGMCKFVHKDVCFVSFDLFQLVFDASAFAIPVTLYYKYRKVTSISNTEVSRFKVKFILLSSYLLSIVVGTIYIATFHPTESLAVETETKDQHSNTYDFTQYAQITGYQNHLWSTMANYLNILSIYIPPLMSITFIRLINKKLNSLKHMFTDKTAAQAKKFDLALTIQTLVPAVCVIPVYTLHIAVNGYDPFYFPAHEKILYILLALPTAIDAFIVIFTITPYRKAFCIFFGACFCCFNSVTPIPRRESSKVNSVF